MFLSALFLILSTLFDKSEHNRYFHVHISAKHVHLIEVQVHTTIVLCICVANFV